jgi:hypothetical protein
MTKMAAGNDRRHGLAIVTLVLGVWGCGAATINRADGGGGASPTGGTGGPSATGGIGGAPATGGTGGAPATGGVAGAAATGGTGGAGTGGLAGSGAAGAGGGCSPESDAQLCASLGKSCETASGTDNCGTTRTANCGTCPSTMGCVDQVCQTPVCSTFNYSSAPYTAGNRTGMEDVVIAASNGQSLVYGQSPGTCGSFNVYVADETAPDSGVYTPRDVTPWITTNNVINNEIGMSGDGLTLVLLSADRTTISSAQRSALQLIDFGTPSSADFKTINGFLTGTSGQFRAPVLSPDGRELYYTIANLSTAVNGIYHATRPSSTGLFPAGKLIPVLTADYEYVTGVSSDRLAIFVFKGFGGFVFTRTSTSGDFVNPNAPNTPPQLGGWLHKPFQNCATLFFMTSPGGCQNEDLYFGYRN